MRIIILGGGTVGSWIAETLCPDHDVTVIDTNPEVIQRLNDHFDVQAFVGSAIDSTLLFQAQTLAMDLCLAVTGDESKKRPCRQYGQTHGMWPSGCSDSFTRDV
jgi:trk system potassium uptake protein TrkA